MSDKETNLYKLTLRDCYTRVIPSARDAVHHGQGQPGDSISSSISTGGWVCARATDFVQAFSEKAKQIIPKFDDAVTTAKSAHDAEPEEVPKGDPHGLAWSRTWANTKKMMAYN